MAYIRRFPLLSHLRSDPSQYILDYRRGQLKRHGRSLSFWFSAMSASLAEVPVEDIETTFILQERSRDLQEVTVQCSLIYRIVDPRKTAERVNFTIDLVRGEWLEEPLERLASLWSQKARPPVRSYLKASSVEAAIREGADVMTRAIAEVLAQDEELTDLGIAPVSVQIHKVAPNAELEKALQTPTREAIQQKADEASFERRALAVEKERAIKENELATEIELARQQKELIDRQGANQLRNVEHEAAARRAESSASAERRQIEAEAEAATVRLKGDAEAEAMRAMSEVDNAAERERVALWSDAPARVHTGLALQQLAKHLPKIEHLNVTPDLIGESLQQWLRDLNKQ